MATHTCTLKVSGPSVVSTWSNNAHKMKIGDTVKFVSGYGNVRLEFANDCPFLTDKIPTVTAFFVKSDTPLSLKLKRLPRGKRYHFLCMPGEAGSWNPNGGTWGDDVPPST